MTSVDFVQIGKISKPYSFKGKMKVFPLTDFPERFQTTAYVLIRNGTGTRSKFILESSNLHGKYVIIKLHGIDTKEDAERLRNMILEVKRNDVLPLEKGRFYIFDLIGMDVYDREDNYHGKVADILRLKSNDVFVVRNGQQELMLPAIEDVIHKIDMKNKKIEFTMLKGLT